MKDFLAIILISVGLVQYLYLGYNIFTLMLLILLCFMGGFISGPAPTRRQKDSDNLANLAQIERNRYFRKD